MSEPLPTVSIQSRYEGIDVLRVFAAFGVICIHTWPLTGQRMVAFSGIKYGELIYLLTTLAVPFFLLAGGYFFAAASAKPGPASGPWRTLRKYAGRLGLMYVIWWPIYAMIPTPGSLRSLGISAAFGRRAASTWTMVRSSPAEALLGGLGIHLWFLPSLLLGLLVCAAMLQFRRYGMALLLSVTSFVCAWLGSTYGGFLAGSKLSFFASSQCLAIAFVPLGALLYVARKPPRAAAAIVLLSGIVLTYSEGLLSHFLWEVPMLDFRVNAGLYLSAAGATWFGLSLQRVQWVRFLLPLAPLTLGIYLIHWHVRDAAYLLWKVVPSRDFWDVAMPFVVFCISSALVWILLQSKLGRRLVA